MAYPIGVYTGATDGVTEIVAAHINQLENKVGYDSDPNPTTLDYRVAYLETNAALLPGRAGGQILKGGTGSGENLTLQSTAHATKGKILFGTSAYDELNNRLGIGTTTPSTSLYVAGHIGVDSQYRIGAGISAGTPDSAYMKFTAEATPQVDIGISGVPKLTVDNNGNVGIGTTIPGVKLDVVGSITSRNVFTVNSGGGATVVGNFGACDDIGTGMPNGTDLVIKSRVAGSNIGFQINNSNIVGLFIKSTGNVGIGTTSPTHALTFPISSTGIALYNTGDQTTNYERTYMKWDTNIFKIIAEKGGTGLLRDIQFGSLLMYADNTSLKHRFIFAPSAVQDARFTQSFNIYSDASVNSIPSGGAKPFVHYGCGKAVFTSSVESLTSFWAVGQVDDGRSVGLVDNFLSSFTNRGGTSITTAHGFHQMAPVNNGTTQEWTIGQFYGLKIDGFIDNNFKNTTHTNDPYGIYVGFGATGQFGGRNYFGSRLGINQIDPSYMLDAKGLVGLGEIYSNPGGPPNNTAFSTGGTFTGTTNRRFRIQIDGVGSPNTFKWSKNNGSTWDATLVPITGAAQTLTEGVTITFLTTTGKPLNQYWNFAAFNYFPLRISTFNDVVCIVATQGGNVGIGTTTPNNKLQVLGLINFDNSLTGTSIGYQAGNVNAGDNNTFVGYNAGKLNTSGNRNTFIGKDAGPACTTGLANTYIGYNSGFGATGNQCNTFVGDNTGIVNAADNNTFIGFKAGFANTSAQDNTFVGKGSGLAATTGGGNTFVGVTTGQALTDGTSNNFIGVGAGSASIHGIANNCFGCSAGGANTGNYNTFLGHSTGLSNITGNSNVFLGFKSGYYETGSNKLFIDNQQRASEADARTKALMYGVFDAAVANQILTINANVGIGTTTPAELLSLGLAGSTKGTLSLSGNTSGKIIIQPAAAAGTYTLTLPTNDGDANQFLQTDGSGILTWATGGIGSIAETARIIEEQASGTNGGTFTSGAWRTRVLNTIKNNFVSPNAVTLSSNQMTLKAGTYFFMSSAPGLGCGLHQARLYNITAGSTALVGTSDKTTAGGTIVSRSLVSGRITIASDSVFELQHRCSSTNNTDGLGGANSFGEVEIYTEINIWRLVA